MPALSFKVSSAPCRTWALALVACACACTSAGPRDVEPAVEPAAAGHEAPAPAAPETTRQEPAVTEDDELQEVEGVFDIERFAGYKRFQGSWLHLDGGGKLVLSYRPMLDYTAFVERRVIVRGEHYSPEGQAISARHFRVTSMRLAAGETARDDVEDGQLPLPPVVRTHDEFKAREGRWIQLYATLVSARPDGNFWRDITLRLDDGATLDSKIQKFYFERLEKDPVGERVTILGNVFSTRPEPGSFNALAMDPADIAKGPFELKLGANTICLGEQADCGMRDQAKK